MGYGWFWMDKLVYVVKLLFNGNSVVKDFEDLFFGVGERDVEVYSNVWYGYVREE